MTRATPPAPGVGAVQPRMTERVCDHAGDSLVPACGACGRERKIPCDDLIKHGFGEWTLAHVVENLRCRHGGACGSQASAVTLVSADRAFDLPMHAGEAVPEDPSST